MNCRTESVELMLCPNTGPDEEGVETMTAASKTNKTRRVRIQAPMKSIF